MIDIEALQQQTGKAILELCKEMNRKDVSEQEIKLCEKAIVSFLHETRALIKKMYSAAHDHENGVELIFVKLETEIKALKGEI